jgi:hypothetical protein
MESTGGPAAINAFMDTVSRFNGPHESAVLDTEASDTFKGRAVSRASGALVLGRQRGDHRLRRTAVPRAARVLAQQGHDVLAGEQVRQVPGHELVLGQWRPERTGRCPRAVR